MTFIRYPHEIILYRRNFLTEWPSLKLSGFYAVNILLVGVWKLLFIRIFSNRICLVFRYVGFSFRLLVWDWDISLKFESLLQDDNWLLHMWSANMDHQPPRLLLTEAPIQNPPSGPHWLNTDWTNMHLKLSANSFW